MLGESVQVVSGDLIAVAAIVIGFGMTAMMFRTQRELWVKENHPDWPLWLACADYLIIVSVVLAIVTVVLILWAPAVTANRRAAAAAASVAALILQAGYIPAVFAHYRIWFGVNRAGDRQAGEPAERAIVYLTIAFAAVAFLTIFCQQR